MKALKYITFVMVGLLLFSCEVDYETDPNNPSVAPTSGIINRVQKRFQDQTGSSFNEGRHYLNWVQMWNQVNYTEEDRFEYRETTNKGTWDAIYTNAQDLVDLIELNTNEATAGDMAAYGPNVNQIAAARIMLVHIYMHGLELWGDIPYWSYGGTNASFQANSLKNEEPIDQPAYAASEDIYMDMISELKAAADAITGDHVIDGDNYFGGDAAKWKKYANSLRLRIANRIKGVYAGAAAEITDAVADGVLASNADNVGVTYEASAVNGAPWYRAFIIGARTDFGPSMQLVEMLQGKRGPFTAMDPRLDIFVADNDNGDKVGVPLTSANSEVSAFTDESLPGDAMLAADATEWIMEYAEVCFIMSENNSWDQTWYEAGVRASMEKWGVAEADIATYIAALPAASEETVMTQKYLALYMQPMEAWAELRRTGYPMTIVEPNDTYDYTYPTADGDVTTTYTFTPLADISTVVPSRNMYPLNEANINATNLAAAIASMGGDAQDTPLWWMN